MFSAVHPTTDIAKMLRHVRFVPIAAIGTAYISWYSLHRTTRRLMPKPVITGLYYGGGDNFIAPDGPPLVTCIIKKPAATRVFGAKSLSHDARAEPAHHNHDKTA